MKEKRQNKLARALRLAKSLRLMSITEETDHRPILNAAANMLEELVELVDEKP